MQFLTGKSRSYAKLLRLDKPIGNFLLLWPTLWALWLASWGVPNIKTLLIFISGVFIMRAAGCVINDFADRNIDGRVSRTKTRPLANGELTVTEALTIFIILCTLALALGTMLKPLVLLIAALGLLLAIIYPFMKRYIYFPQVILGLAWYVSIPMAFAEVASLNKACWLLYGAAVIWTVIYDTMYAMVDREDDLKLGLKSTAILFAEYDKLYVALLQLLMVAVLVYLGYFLRLNIYYFLSLGVVTILFVWQQVMIKNREPLNCFKAFLNNNWVGLVIFVGILQQH
jgi:4-hydroxybenzoate polyprenyltransferase